MTEQVITTKKGTYGRLQVTLPMSSKQSIISWINKSGMGKAEFLRVALLMGCVKLADQLEIQEPEKDFSNSTRQNEQTIYKWGVNEPSKFYGDSGRGNAHEPDV